MNIIVFVYAWGQSNPLTYSHDRVPVCQLDLACSIETKKTVTNLKLITVFRSVYIFFVYISHCSQVAISSSNVFIFDLACTSAI